MKSAEKTVSPTAVAVMAICAAGTALVSLLFQPATELIQAQVQPAARTSGESPVRLPEVMQGYAKLGIAAVSALESIRKPIPLAQEESGNPNPPPVVMPKDYAEWQKEVVTQLGDKQAKDPEHQKKAGDDYVKGMTSAVGDQDFQKLVSLYLTDPNYCYYAYALFLGIAMFLGSIAILAIGRYEAEEVTVIPVKK